MNATIDLGGNTTQLIEQLATQLNMTVDKVFPWYVEMVKLEAYYWFWVVGGLAGLSVLIFTGSMIAGIVLEKRQADWENLFIPICMCAAFFFGVCVTALLVDGTESLAQLKVPEPYAIKALVSDAGRLLGK